jgi:hypothetical protein
MKMSLLAIKQNGKASEKEAILKNRPNQVNHCNGYFGQDSPSEDQIEPFLRKVPPFRVRCRDIQRHKGQKNNH